MIKNILRGSSSNHLSRMFTIGGMDPSKDYYKELELSSTASTIEIKKAYFKMVKMYHPDQNKGIDLVTRLRNWRTLQTH